MKYTLITSGIPMEKILALKTFLKEQNIPHTLVEDPRFTNIEERVTQYMERDVSFIERMEEVYESYFEGADHEVFYNAVKEHLIKDIIAKADLFPSELDLIDSLDLIADDEDMLETIMAPQYT